MREKSDARTGRVCRAAGIAGAAMLATCGRAADGTITFIGAVIGNSCTVQVNGAGAGDGVVTLPTVDTTALDNGAASGGAAAGTFFRIALTSCGAGQADTSSAAPTRVAVYFEAGPNVDPATHALINSGTSNVEVKLYQASATDVVGSGITPGVDDGQSTSQSVATASTQHFYAGYSTRNGVPATAGTVSTTVTYSLVYD